MKIKSLIKKLESSNEFKEWRKDHNESFLAHVFKMVDQEDNGSWQVGYYNPDDTITTFFIEGESIHTAKKSEIFKKPDAKILGLDLSKVEFDYHEALKIARGAQESNHSNEIPIKTLIILQALPIGIVYNITFITRAFNTLNLKVDSHSGKIVDKKLTNFMNFGSVLKD